jgi:hypothetical protein
MGAGKDFAHNSLLVIGCSLLVSGYSLLVARDGLPGTRYGLPITVLKTHSLTSNQ